MIPCLHLIGKVLSRMLQEPAEKRLLDKVKMNVGVGGRGAVISHILFVDNTLVFLKTDRKNCRNLVSLLEAYCSALGQGINSKILCVLWGQIFGMQFPLSLVASLVCLW